MSLNMFKNIYNGWTESTSEQDKVENKENKDLICEFVKKNTQAYLL